MEISFKTIKLARLISSKKLLVKKYGNERARLIMRRIVFVPDHDPLPRKRDDAGIDLSKVTKIKITWIGDYHG